jgi:hypothetical protein
MLRFDRLFTSFPPSWAGRIFPSFELACGAGRYVECEPTFVRDFAAVPPTE